MVKSKKEKKKEINKEHMLGTQESRLIASLKDEKPAKVIINKHK